MPQGSLLLECLSQLELKIDLSKPRDYTEDRTIAANYLQTSKQNGIYMGTLRKLKIADESWHGASGWSLLPSLDKLWELVKTICICSGVDFTLRSDKPPEWELDLIILILPIPALIQLRINLKKKMSLMLMFRLGSF